LNVHGVNDVRQTEIHTDGTPIPKHSSFEGQFATEKLKSHKLPGTDQIPAEFIQVGGNTFHFEIHDLINSIWNKEKLPQQWKQSTVVFVYKKGHKTGCSNY
jgi:hypothetical protein